MCQLCFLVGITVAELQAVGLERLEVGNRRDLQPAFLRLGVDLEIVGQRRGERHVAAAQAQNAVGQPQRPDDRLHVRHHAVERFVRRFGQAQLHDLDLVELVQAVQSAHVLAVRTGFAAEAGGVGGHLHREVLFV